MTGVVAWFTGLPRGGKSTLAAAVAERLRCAGVAPVLLDGDEVRGALVPRPGYTPDERDPFYATLARLAALLARQGHVVLVAATAHRRAFRAEARALAPRFIEVHVDVSADACAVREGGELYRGASRDALPGAGVAYEPPLAADVRATGGRDELAAQSVVDRIFSSRTATS
jgi:adenylylsulfate kinase